MLSCSDAAADNGGQQRDHYGERCALLREERRERGTVRAAEMDEWVRLCVICADATDAELAREDERRRATARPPTPRPPLYVYRFRAGTTDSVLPVRAPVLSRSARCGAAEDVEAVLLASWESENRDDMCEWEASERREMMQAVDWIVAAQHARELIARERACRKVLRGTTSLDWASYPAYESDKVHS
ncbi:hypothetical protein NESM_000131900 [Novymonas esmeraldas]|uniref:Uncharacterized protein n=1 Tax=Novymonas esmeraldas TaxID=1808958 RepID=A0AAW0F3I9_9TRYP